MISPEEVKLVLEAEAARDDTIEVDSFTLDDYLRTSTQDRPEPNQRIVPLAS